uniref:Uncharacterized protein LOC113797683 n=1 Tax=Dermatophagoides pteronyssinus TaxID=6956 RepID=A0A6P6YGB8_DERPT|nr:uncharacterized protein LOC113797683 [Dermatophagoides pteronyssinus]
MSKLIDDYLFRFDLIHYSDTIEFLVGDFNLITEVKYGSLRRIYSSFVMFALITIGFTIYQSFNTEISKAFRTFIMYSYEYETNNKILDKFVANEIEFSRSTVILFDYLRQRFDPKFVEFKSSFNKFYCLARLVHFEVNCLGHLIKLDKFIQTKPLWQVIGRVFGFQITCISIDFLLTFIYCPIMIGYYIEPYYSRLIFMAIIIAFVINQFVWSCIENVRSDQYLLRALFYYYLLLNYSNLLILTYWISKLNTKLNSFGYFLQKTIWYTNSISDSCFKLHLLFIYERMVSKNKWGMKLGPFTVLTRVVFAKMIIFYIRFVMLTNKLFK